MSAILGVFGNGEALTRNQVSSLLAQMHARGIERTEVWRDQGVLLAVGRYEWELQPAFSGPVLLASDPDLVVAADASLYYRASLSRALNARGVVPASDAPADLILAAYRFWGTRCIEQLEGDFAFIVWDRAKQRALVARDAGGKRPVHYADLGDQLVVASSISAVVNHPRCPDQLNLPMLGATAAGLIFSAGPETCYSAVRVLPNAHTLSWAKGRAGSPVRYWEPSFGDTATSRLPQDQAAEHLRELLCVATRERLVAGEVNTVWMSGGWDSTSVFAAAQESTRRTTATTQIRPVSISYPRGDPGREDELITDVAARWQARVHWIDIADIPFFDREEQRAAERDQPYAHLYEKWNRALAAGTRDCGARVALDGNGGDQLFQNSDIYLADLLRSGKWFSLVREWRSRRRRGFRNFFGLAIQPNLPDSVLGLAATLRGGRRLQHYLERRLPEWLVPQFVQQHELAARDREFLGRPIRASHAQREIDWQFTCLFIARAFDHLGEFALSTGVELRSPLLDRSVINLALSRPWWERSSGKESKRLLRRAMRGLLPDNVLAPRAYRTGVTSGYSHRWMRDVFPRLLEDTLATPLLLEELGIVQTAELRQACAQYARTGDPFTRVNLFYTLQTELWLRARSAGRGADMAYSSVAAGMVA